MGIEVRRLTPDRWATWRALRLHALRADPHVYSSSFARECAWPESRWRAALDDRDAAVFGVWAGPELVGVTSVALTADPTVASLTASWLAPGWRGRGLSRVLYAVRLQWAHVHPTARRVTVCHRVGNDASGRANRRFGFRFTHRAPLRWPDGTVEDEVCYALDLPPKRAATVRRAPEHASR